MRNSLTQGLNLCQRESYFRLVCGEATGSVSTVGFPRAPVEPQYHNGLALLIAPESVAVVRFCCTLRRRRLKTNRAHPLQLRIVQAMPVKFSCNLRRSATLNRIPHAPAVIQPTSSFKFAEEGSCFLLVAGAYYWVLVIRCTVDIHVHLHLPTILPLLSYSMYPRKAPYSNASDCCTEHAGTIPQTLVHSTLPDTCSTRTPPCQRYAGS